MPATAAAPTIAETRTQARAQLVDDARADPLVAAVLQRFPGAEIVDVRVRAAKPALPGRRQTTAPAPDDMMDEDD